MASYVFKGRLCGLICAECPEPLSQVTVRLYQLRSDQNPTVLAVANPKDTLALLSDEQVAAKAKHLLAEGQADADGRFVFELGEQQGYDGGAFEIDVYCGTVPRRKPSKVPPRPRQFSITTLQPLFRDRVAVWEYCLPSRFWCTLRGLFGAWTICGRLRTCAAPQAAIAGATVKAFDADWLQDDALGTAVTDATGRFRIDYLADDFKKDVLGLNLELFGGPDVYFSADLGGINILREPQAAGRRSGRENVGPCFCVELCSEAVQSGNVGDYPHWKQVEIFDIQPFPQNTSSGFSAEGYAGGAANSYVFGGLVSLRGNCPLRNAAAHPLEYRYLIGEWSWPGGVEDPTVLPTIAPTTLTPVIQLARTHVGYVYYGPGLLDSAPVYIDASDLLPDGWIRLDGKAVTVDLRNGSTAVVNLTATNFLRTFELFTVNSPAITSAHPARLPGGLPLQQAGRSLLVAEREPIRRYRLRFEVRDGTTQATTTTDELDAIVLDNSPVAAALDLEELRSSACNPVAAGAVHLLYTVDHPHLRSFSMGISNNSGSMHAPPQLPSGAFAPPPPSSNYLFRGGAGGPHQPLNDDGGFAVDVSADPPCAYRAALSWHTRHYGALPTGTDRLYCK